MKSICIIVLWGLLLCGCSQKQASSSGRAIDRVQVGDTSWPGGQGVYTLHVTKRDGTSVFGVSISAKLPTGETQTVSADTATLSAAPNAKDDRSVMITFHNAKIQTGSKIIVLDQGPYRVVLHE